MDLYVDGGSRRAQTGEHHGAAAWRVIGERGEVIDEGVRFVPDANAQEAELAACLYGLERCADLGVGPKLIVFTDCGSTQDALTNPRAFRTGTPMCIRTAGEIRTMLKRLDVRSVQRVTRRHHGIRAVDRLCDALFRRLDTRAA